MCPVKKIKTAVSTFILPSSYFAFICLSSSGKLSLPFKIKIFMWGVLFATKSKTGTKGAHQLTDDDSFYWKKKYFSDIVF